MKISWRDSQQIERYLAKTLGEDEQQAFETALARSPLLRLNVRVQKKTMELLRHYHRRKLKRNAEQVRDRLFQDTAKTAFQQEITQLFKN